MFFLFKMEFEFCSFEIFDSRQLCIEIVQKHDLEPMSQISSSNSTESNVSYMLFRMIFQ